MADRRAFSPVCTALAGLAGLCKEIRLTGIRVGEVISSTVPWAKANPVIAPHVLRLTSAVACCQVGFLSVGLLSVGFLSVGFLWGGTDSPPFSSAFGPGGVGKCALSSVSGSLPHVRQRLENRLHLRITWVAGVGEQHADGVGRGRRVAYHPLPVRLRDQRRLTCRAGHRLRALAGEARVRDDSRRAGIPGAVGWVSLQPR